MGGGSTKVPAPTAEERALQQSQADLLNMQREIIEQQRAQQAILLPFLAQQEGYNVEVDENGNIISISEGEPTEGDLQQEEIERLFNERTLAALKGELPVSPALEQDLARQEEQLRNRLSQQFGPGYETSTPGIETLGEFFSQAEGLREGARTGQLTLSEQLGLAREQQNQFTQRSGQDYLRQLGVGDPLSFAGAFGQVASGFGQAQQPYIQQRQLQAQASAANASNRSNLIGAGIGLVGSLFSDERLKENAIEIGEVEPFGIPIYVYEYDGEEYLGVFAGDVEAVLPGSVGERYGYRTVQYGDLDAHR